MDDIKVIIWGFGAMGKGIAKMLLEKKGVKIVGICDIDKKIVGQNFTNVLGVNTKHESVFISDNIDYLLKNHKVDVVLLATDSYTKKAYPKISKIITYGINVISTAEEMAYPQANEPLIAQEINNLARKAGVTVLGTGINPGFIMDFLVVAMTGTMEKITHIKAERVNSLSPFGPTVMEEQGVGISLDAYNERCDKNDLAGHVGFKESVYMIADAIGVKISQFEQQMKPILSNVYRKSTYGEVKPGFLAGIDMTAQGIVNDKIFIEMKHPQQIEPQLEGIQTGDYITLSGVPNINLSIKPEIEGGIGTIAMCVNMIPHVINAKPGLKTMIDLPIPRAILGDMRELIDR